MASTQFSEPGQREKLYEQAKSRDQRNRDIIAIEIETLRAESSFCLISSGPVQKLSIWSTSYCVCSNGYCYRRRGQLVVCGILSPVRSSPSSTRRCQGTLNPNPLAWSQVYQHRPQPENLHRCITHPGLQLTFLLKGGNEL